MCVIIYNNTCESNYRINHMVSYFYDWFGKNNEELQRNLRMFKDAGKTRLVKRNGEDKGFKGKMRKIHTLLCETLDLVRGP